MTEPLFTTLEFFDDRVPHDGPFSMAVDEVLLTACAETPLLRIYRWDVSTVSFGYFEPLAVVRARFPQASLVRRWTGGGIVEHGADLTYSLLIPRRHPFARHAVVESYRLIHQAVGRAIRSVGFGNVTLAETVANPTETRSPACFANPVPHDLMSAGQKIAGAAQRRSRHGLLHQGSIQGLGVEGRTGLATALPGSLGLHLQGRDISLPEREAARELAQAKYGDPSWTGRC